LNLRVWRYAAILAIVLGPALLWNVACRGEIPLVEAQAITLSMNGDCVRVQGVVARYPDYDPIAERLAFLLDDGTGTVLVILKPDEVRALLDRNQVPTVGDRVSVAGIVRAGTARALGDFVSLTVGALAHLEVKAPVPVESSVADAVAGALYSKVLVKGQVSEVWQPYGALTILRLQDGTGEIDVVYDQNLVWISGAPTVILPGDFVGVRGVVTDHNGQSQIALDAASGLQRLSELAAQTTAVQADGARSAETSHGPTVTVTIMPASPTPTESFPMTRPTSTVTTTLAPVLRGDSERIEPGAAGASPVQTGALPEAPLGSSVMVEGRLEQATLLSAGCKSVVNDGSGPGVVWLPNALYGQLVDPEGWNVGAVVRVTGRVSEYNGELEVVPQSPDAIVTVQRSLPAAAPDVEIGTLSVADLDRRVTVEGEIVAVDPFSAGVKCELDDGTGQVTLLLWQNVFEVLVDRESLAAGARVRASGWVQEYRGDLEIVPGLAYDVVLLGSAGNP
jgi:DNA/RNA endonuclease YhcR with UshA esterase domain